jgi:L-lactate dehydrogenase complex protein LldF
MTTFLGLPRRRPEEAEAYSGGNVVAHEDFPHASKRELKDEQLRTNLRHATHTIRDKRLRVVGELSDWEELRTSGSEIKAHAMSRLPELLEEFERNATAAGATVHWARDAIEANDIIRGIIEEQRTPEGEPVREVIKVKSMATQEIGLNESLEAHGIAAIETDLAELIVQLDHDLPSHILVPAIHKNRDQIRDIFVREMEDAPAGLTNNPAELAAAARVHLRRKFLSTTVAISGANFAIADTGTLGVVESEGNGRMCLTLPDTLISLVGIEKVLPSFEDIHVMGQLLPRSSTGERMNPYTSLWTGVTPGDGPQNVHIVLLDNGRTRALADEYGRSALHCIRCSACMNVCPVYERTGGHAYGSTYPGPIGAILSPLLTGVQVEDNDSLPFASTLCGACYDACPVKINIPDILVHLRGRSEDARTVPEKATQLDGVLAAAGRILGSGENWARVQKGLGAARAAARFLPGPGGAMSSLPGVAGKWTAYRDVPAPPRHGFRADFAAGRTPYSDDPAAPEAASAPTEGAAE